MRHLLASLLLALACGCTTTNQIVPKAPPTAPTETRSPRPYANAYWRTGHYAWDEGRQLHYWVPGTWQENREGYVWFPGEWEPVNDGAGERIGWRWVDERWVQLVDLERTEHGE